MIDWKARLWQDDISAFYRWNKFLEICHSKTGRKTAIARLMQIKERWPRELRDEIIPEA